MIHEFTIVAAGVIPEAENFEDRFFAASCDDATLIVPRGPLVLAYQALQ